MERDGWQRAWHRRWWLLATSVATIGLAVVGETSESLHRRLSGTALGICSRQRRFVVAGGIKASKPRRYRRAGKALGISGLGAAPMPTQRPRAGPARVALPSLARVSPQAEAETCRPVGKASAWERAGSSSESHRRRDWLRPISAERPKRSPRSTLTKEESFIPLIFLMKEKQKIKQTMHFRRPSAGLPAPGGVPSPPLPSSAAGGAASGDAGERPAVAEGRSWILPLAKMTPDVTNSSC